MLQASGNYNRAILNSRLEKIKPKDFEKLTAARDFSHPSYQSEDVLRLANEGRIKSVIYNQTTYVDPLELRDFADIHTDYISAREASKITGLSTNKLKALSSRGVLESTKHGKFVYYEKTAVEKLSREIYDEPKRAFIDVLSKHLNIDSRTMNSLSTSGIPIYTGMNEENLPRIKTDVQPRVDERKILEQAYDIIIADISDEAELVDKMVEMTGLERAKVVRHIKIYSL